MKAVIFDLDDTLYPERAYAFSGFEAVAEQFADRLGDPHETAAAMQHLFDTEDRARVFNAILRDCRIDAPAELVNEMVDAFRRHRPTISLYADADAALTRLRGCCGLGIISDGRAVQQRAKVKALGLTARVDAIILTDELGSEFSKPHLRAFELMADRLGAAHYDCLYVADNPAKDFIAPNALGWHTVRIIRPDGIYHDVPIPDGGTPERIVRSLDELNDVTD